jgi:hypothetical protein
METISVSRRIHVSLVDGTNSAALQRVAMDRKENGREFDASRPSCDRHWRYCVTGDSRRRGLKLRAES